MVYLRYGEGVAEMKTAIHVWIWEGGHVLVVMADMGDNIDARAVT